MIEGGLVIRYLPTFTYIKEVSYDLITLNFPLIPT